MQEKEVDVVYSGCSASVQLRLVAVACVFLLGLFVIRRAADSSFPGKTSPATVKFDDPVF
jgi:hypothetical protein